MTRPPTTPEAPPVLVLVQDEATRAGVLAALAGLACSILADNTAEAEAMLRHQPFAVIIVEDELPQETGIMFLARINALYPWLRRILICGRPEPDLLFFLINEANVFRCAPKPIDPPAFRTMVTDALADHQRARQLAASAADNERLRAELASPGHRTRHLTANLRHWFASLPKIFMFSLIGAAWVFALGVVVLLTLYGLKTILGIDLIDDLHLRDLFR